MENLEKTSPSMTSSPAAGLRGDITPPGDKSISHRSVMFGAIAKGQTRIHGLLESEDVLCTMAAMRAAGAHMAKEGDVWVVEGVGLDGLAAPAVALDMGNSGTSTRLLMGLFGARPMETRFMGDASLSKRPMARVTVPLSQMGAQFVTQEGGRLPLTVTGPLKATAITYDLPVASAQVKSAVLLAGLSADGVTSVIERVPTRDHTERMLRHFGADVQIQKGAEGEVISVTGHPVLTGQEITVPADISSAAFPMVAALLCPGSDVTLRHVGMNERRTGIIKSLLEMGGHIEITNRGEACGEPVADLIVRHSNLHGVTIGPERAPSMIDEFPVLSMAAACALGTSRFCGLAELRVKESDRLALVEAGLKACGVKVEIEGDDLIIHGDGTVPKPSMGLITTALDHRIAMSFLVLGVVSGPISIDDGRPMATSFPDFVPMMNGLGAKITGLA